MARLKIVARQTLNEAHSRNLRARRLDPDGKTLLIDRKAYRIINKNLPQQYRLTNNERIIVTKPEKIVIIPWSDYLTDRSLIRQAVLRGSARRPVLTQQIHDLLDATERGDLAEIREIAGEIKARMKKPVPNKEKNNE